MAYDVTFNLTANVWRSTTPTTLPPDLISAAQLYHTKVVGTEYTFQDTFAWRLPSQIRFPARTDVQPGDLTNSSPGDTIEIPAGSGIFYVVHQVLDFHRGFTNEYRVAFCLMSATPLPMP